MAAGKRLRPVAATAAAAGAGGDAAKSEKVRLVCERGCVLGNYKQVIFFDHRLPRGIDASVAHARVGHTLGHITRLEQITAASSIEPPAPAAAPAAVQQAADGAVRMLDIFLIFLFFRRFEFLTGVCAASCMIT